MRAKGNVLRAGHRAGLLVSGVRAKGLFVENVIEGNLDGVVLASPSASASPSPSPSPSP